MNFFSSTDPTIFSTLNPELPENFSASPLDGDTINSRARIAAMANVDTKSPDLLGDMNRLSQGYADTIKNVGDYDIRREAAAKGQLNELQALARLSREGPGLEPGTQEGIAEASSLVIAEDIERRKQYALEKKAIENIQNLAAQGDATQAKLLLNNLEHGDTNRVMIDYQTKKLILQRKIQDAQVAVKDQPWFLDVMDFILSATPVVNSSMDNGGVDIPKSMQHWYDNLAGGQRIRAESDTLWNMPAADFAEYVEKHLIPNVQNSSKLLGYESKSAQLQALSKLKDFKPWDRLGIVDPTLELNRSVVNNTGNAVDNLGWLSFSQINKVVSIPGLMIRNGGRRAAVDTIAAAATIAATEGAETAAARTGMTLDGIAAEILPGAVNDMGTATTVGLANEAVSAMERVRALIDSLPKFVQPGRFANKDEFDEAVGNLMVDMDREFNRPVKDLRLVTQKLADRSEVFQVEFMLGKTDGAGFANQGQATRFANSLGYAGAETVADESGQFFVKLVRDIPETGTYTNNLNVKATNWLARRVLSASAIQDQLLSNIAQQSGNNHAKIMKALANDYVKVFTKLSKTERESLSQVIAKGANEETWYNDDQLVTFWSQNHNRAPTANEIEAYHTARNVNDVEFTLRNDELYKRKIIEGKEGVSFSTGMGGAQRENARVVRGVPRDFKGTAYDINRGTFYNKDTTPDLDLLDNEGYIHVKLDRPIKIGDKEVNVFYGKPSDFKIEPVRRDQLAYSAGGHRIYKGKYFVKQAAIKNVDGVTTYYNPKTHIVAETYAEADFWTKRMEQARIAANRGADETELDEIFEGRAGFPSGREFIDNLNDGVYERDASFRAMFDREELPEYVAARDSVDYRDPNSTGSDQHLETYGRLYYSSKGERLKDWTGQLAPTLNPYETINRSLVNVANLTSLSDYKMTAIERWVNTFEKAGILDSSSYGPNDSATAIFLKARINTGGGKELDKLRQGAEAQREVTKRTLSWKTEQDLRGEEWARSIEAWVGGSDPEGWRNQAAKTVNWAITSDPVNKLRGMAFDMKLGLLNVGQFPKQISTIWAATSLSPKHGFNGMMSLLPLRSYILHSSGDEVLDLWESKGIVKLAGFRNRDDFREFMKSAKMSGFFDVNNNHAMMNAVGPDATISQFGNSIDKARNGARFFFNEAEVWNRAVAWRIAWNETREAFPGLAVNGPEFTRELSGRANKYSFSMTNESAAWWQKGALSIPTQFWAYQARMLEAMLGKEFTGRQRIQLLLGQTMMYGAAGTPVTAYIADKIKASNPDASGDSALDTFWGALDRGLLDQVMYRMTGADVEFGATQGTGAWLPQTIEDIFGVGQYGEKSVAEFATGATGSVVGSALFDGLNAVGAFATAMTGGDGYELTEERLLKLAKNVSSINNSVKAYMVFKYGTYATSKGSTTVSDLPSVDAFGVAMGFQPGEVDQLGSQMEYMKNQSKQVDEVAKTLNNYKTRWVNEPDNRAEINAQINIFMKMQDPIVRQKALKKSHGSADKSLYDSVSKQIEKERTQRIMLKNMQEGYNGGAH